MQKNKRVLITGGAGFIGSALQKELSSDDEILIVDNFHPQVHRSPASLMLFPENVSLLKGDVCDPVVMSQAAAFHPDVVVHLAAETGTGQSLTNSRRHADVNVSGTAALMDALSIHEWFPRRIVLTSSRAVYGEGAWADPETGEPYYGRARVASDLDSQKWSPNSPSGQTGQPLPNEALAVEPRPTNVYAGTKLAQEHLLSAWCTAFDVPLGVLRLQNVYGAGQAIDNSYTGVLTYFARQLSNGVPVHVFEGGGILRDFVHISDVAIAVRSAVDFTEAQDFTVDIGSGKKETLLEVAGAMARVAKQELPVISNEYRLGDVRAAFADNSAAERLLNYRPKTSLDVGLPGLLSWVADELEAR